MTPFAWVGFAVIAAVLYGVLNDQITVSLSREYFSIFKRQQFGPLLEAAGLGEAPTRVQAMAIGAAATWWFGLLLGTAVGAAGTLGRSPRLTTHQFLQATWLVILTAAAASLIFGAGGYIAADLHPSSGSVAEELASISLAGIEDTRAFYAVGWWHNGAYLGGLGGMLAACVRVWKWRWLQ